MSAKYAIIVFGMALELVFFLLGEMVGFLAYQGLSVDKVEQKARLAKFSILLFEA